MAKRLRNSSDQEREFGAVLEDMNDKFQVILEATAPIPKMQQDIGTMQDDIGTMQADMGAMQESVETMQGQIGHIMAWEENVRLIPAIFEEVGELRKEVDVLKEAVKLLGRHDTRLDAIDQRLVVLEHKAR